MKSDLAFFQRTFQCNFDIQYKFTVISSFLILFTVFSFTLFFLYHFINYFDESLFKSILTCKFKIGVETT